MPPVKPSNRAASASKLGTVEKKQQQKKNSSPRSPLKVIRDLNALSSRSSSSSSATNDTSISSDAQRGCLRFFLSHHNSSSSNAAKNGSNRPKFVASKTPKSAPDVKNSRWKLSAGNSSIKKFNILQNPEKPISKRPPPSSRSGVCGKFSSGFELKLSDNADTFTPVAKLATGSGLENFTGHNRGLKLGEESNNNLDFTSPIPPIQASVSPEMQYGGSTSVVAATPTTCYAAGHVLSGVSDRRKCRSRGILTIGDNDLFGSCKTKMSENGDEKLTKLVNVNNHRISLVPSPIEASMQWFLSPCDEESSVGQKDDGAKGELGLKQCEFSVSLGCSSSPPSSLGFSSELFNMSNSTITTSDDTSTTRSSRRSMSCVLSPESASKIRGFLGPSFDHLVCSPSPFSSDTLEICKVEDSLEQGSIGSDNVIQTPTSNSSSPNFGMFDASRDEISRLWFECELDSVSESLRGVSLSPKIPKADSPKTSFEFNLQVEYNSSIDFALAMKDIDIPTLPRSSESLMHNLHDSHIRMSSMNGLVNHISEVEESDCCRCFSDEDDSDNCVDPVGSRFSPELGAIGSHKFSTHGCDPNKIVQHKEGIQRKDKSSPLKQPKSLYK